MSVVTRTLGEKRLVAYMKGAPETVGSLCRQETGEQLGGSFMPSLQLLLCVVGWEQRVSLLLVLGGSAWTLLHLPFPIPPPFLEPSQLGVEPGGKELVKYNMTFIVFM